MAVNQHLVRRSGDLKRELVKFAQGPRFAVALREAREKRFGRAMAGDEGELIEFLDHFVLRYPLADGRTVVDHFVAAHPELPDAERAMLLGWRDVVEGIFAVRRRDGDALVVVNLVDDLTYRVHSNMGPRVFDQTPPGSFIIGRLVPMDDEWLVSGAMNSLPAADRDEVYRAAATMAAKHPALVFRNPERLEQGWELQRKERAAFIAFFGSDLVVLPGHELAERLRAFGHFRTYELRDDEGRTVAERAREMYGFVPPEPAIELPDELRAAEAVGLIYDEVDGLNFLADFNLVAEAFAHPERASEGDHLETVRSYLEDPTVSPRLLRRLAEAHPERASALFRRVLKRPRFSWEQDGEALLRRHKAEYVAHPVWPSVTPVSGELAQAQIAPSTVQETLPAGHKPGRNDPCPCGSGKKYKKCHGR